MKKIIGIALVLALALTLCFSTVALAGPGDAVHTSWDFDGEGEINIHTEMSSGSAGTDGAVGGVDSFNIVTYGSGGSGWQDVSSYPAGYYDWKGFSIDRQVNVENGSVSTFTVRDNTGSGWYWPAYTEYGAHLETDGSGFLSQSFSNVYSSAHMNTYVEADCLYNMGAMVEGSIGGYFFFGIGGEGDGKGQLGLDTNDRPWHNGYRLLWGSFGFEGDTDAGFATSWDTLADFDGYVQTSTITQPFDVNVSGSGGEHFIPDDQSWVPGYSESASSSWVTINGLINAMK